MSNSKKNNLSTIAIVTRVGDPFVYTIFNDTSCHKTTPLKNQGFSKTSSTKRKRLKKEKFLNNIIIKKDIQREVLLKPTNSPVKEEKFITNKKPKNQFKKTTILESLSKKMPNKKMPEPSPLFIKFYYLNSVFFLSVIFFLSTKDIPFFHNIYTLTRWYLVTVVILSTFLLMTFTTPQEESAQLFPQTTTKKEKPKKKTTKITNNPFKEDDSESQTNDKSKKEDSPIKDQKLKTITSH